MRYLQARGNIIVSTRYFSLIVNYLQLEIIIVEGGRKKIPSYQLTRGLN